MKRTASILVAVVAITIGDQITAASIVQPKPKSSGDTVYKAGKKYHSPGCRSLSKRHIPVALEDARKFYDPCRNCNPPQ